MYSLVLAGKLQVKFGVPDGHTLAVTIGSIIFTDALGIGI